MIASALKDHSFKKNSVFEFKMHIKIISNWFFILVYEKSIGKNRAIYKQQSSKFIVKEDINRLMKFDLR